MLKIVLADLLSELELQPVHQKSLLTRKHALDLNISDHKRICMEIICPLLLNRLIFSCCLFCNYSQKGILRHSSLTTAYDDRIYGLRSETQHIKFRDIRLNLDIRNLQILLQSIHHKHFDTLTKDVTKIIDLDVGLGLL